VIREREGREVCGNGRADDLFRLGQAIRRRGVEMEVDVPRGGMPPAGGMGGGKIQLP
jgi:hypothetical protein